MNRDGLEAPRYLHATLLEILSGDYDEDKIAEKGIISITNNKGEEVYFHPWIMETYPDILENKSPLKQQELFETILDDVVLDVPFTMSFFRYNGKGGVVVFMEDMVSHHGTAVKISIVLIWIFYLGFILLPVLVMGFFMRPVSHAILKLENAATEIGRGNWNVDLKVENFCGTKKHHPLEDLIQAFDNMRTELKENHERQQRIMMSISHDLKTPLTSIKGYLEVLQDGMADDPEKILKYTTIIKDKADLLEERINDLIHFSRVQTIEWQSRFSDFNLCELLNEVGGVFKNDALIRQREIDVKIDLPEQLSIKGDRKMFFQVMENLFDNACRYTAKEDKLRFCARVENNNIHIAMEDSGAGIAAEHVPYIFDNFYRADSGRNTRGIGVGLASCKTIIQSHNGTIQYESSDLGGARFHIAIPYSQG